MAKEGNILIQGLRDHIRLKQNHMRYELTAHDLNCIVRTNLVGQNASFPVWKHMQA